MFHALRVTRLVCCLGTLCGLAAVVASAATIGTTMATPATVSVGTVTTVTVTSVIADPSVIPSTVNLQSLNSSGQVVAVLGILHDDGLNGDAAANDHNYTLQTPVYQTSPGTITLRVSAGFKGSLARSFSAPVAVKITGTGIGINILSPANLLYTSLSPVNVTGTVGDPNAHVAVNGIKAPVTGGQFLATVPLVEGLNTLTAVATNSGGTETTASVQVTLDTTPPHLTIDSPAAGTTTTASSITVTGTANDIVVGTVNNGDVGVTVNGIAAQVANRTYSATKVPLAVGPNTIQAVGRDRAGNGTTVTATVTRTLPSQPPTPTIGAAVITYSLNIISGDGQTGAIGTMLTSPLVVALKNSAGAPVANQPLVFSVTGNNGTVGSGGMTASHVAVNTNASGQAQVSWTLGQRSGAGVNMVQVTSALAVGSANFSATGTVSNAAQIVVDSGNNQTGALNQALTFPLVAVVTDSGFNRVPNVPVTFTVMQGGGTFAGTQSQNITTDSNGRALAVLTLGSQPGNDNNAVQASFSGNPGLPASFTASAKAPGNPANTTISGVVLDNSNNPIPGTTIRLFLTNQGNNNNLPLQIGTPVQTNAKGTFLIQQAPVGFFKLMADGSTAPGPKVYPTLEYDLVTIAGQDNTVGTPIYLPALDTVNKLCVDASHGGTLTLPQVPGFSLTVLPGSATFPGGSKTGCVSVTPVNGDKVPMTPGFGQQPRFIVTIQPVGTTFNPPAPITIPNADGLKPRAITEMYSYDHDLSMFVAIGTGTVSNDGSVIASNAGVGVLKAGWHCGGNPNSSGTAASLHLNFSQSKYFGSVTNTVVLTASGGPPDIPPSVGEYINWTVDDPSVAVIVSSQNCPNMATCPITIVGASPGTTTIHVTYICHTTNQTITAGATVTIVKVLFTTKENIEPLYVHSLDAKTLLTSDSFDQSRLTWSITSTTGTPALIAQDGTITFGQGAGLYTIHAESSDLPGTFDEFQLKVLDWVLGAHSNVDSSAGFLDGHAWISITDFSHSSTPVTTYGLWPDGNPAVAQFGFSTSFLDSDVRLNLEEFLGAPYGKYNRYLFLSPDAKQRLVSYVNAFHFWTPFFTCADFASSAVQTATGATISASDHFLFGTPRAFGTSIKTLESSDPTAKLNPANGGKTASLGSSSFDGSPQKP